MTLTTSGPLIQHLLFPLPPCQAKLHLVYLFYPETAGRTLEDIDRFFAGRCPLLVYKDKEAIASTRPTKYLEQEQDEMRRNSSVVAGDAAAMAEARRQSWARKDSMASGREHAEKV